MGFVSFGLCLIIIACQKGGKKQQSMILLMTPGRPIPSILTPATAAANQATHPAQ
jgi:hypothetical protein